MKRLIEATLTKTFNNKPLVVISDTLLGGDAARTPEQLRALADVLQKMASDVETAHPGKPTDRPIKRVYELSA